MVGYAHGWRDYGGLGSNAVVPSTMEKVLGWDRLSNVDCMHNRTS